MRSALVVLRLIGRSNLVGCSMGKSLGFTPRLPHWFPPREKRHHPVPTSASGNPSQFNGRMFWFMRKKFFESYFVFNSWRRR